MWKQHVKFTEIYYRVRINRKTNGHVQTKVAGQCSKMRIEMKKNRLQFVNCRFDFSINTLKCTSIRILFANNIDPKLLST